MSIERPALTVLSSMAVRPILADLASAFGEAAGRDVALTAMGGVTAAGRVRAGDGADVVILASDAMAALQEDGHILPGGLAPFAASGIAVAIPAGAPPLDISDEAALERATLAARTLCCSTGPSGTYLIRLWRSWGVDTADPERVRVAPPGVPVARLLAEGEGDLGFQQLSELAGLPGIEVLGPLPPPVQRTTIFTAGIGIGTTDPTIARAFLAFLNSDRADAVKRRHGMEPPPRDGGIGAAIDFGVSLMLDPGGDRHGLPRGPSERTGRSACSSASSRSSNRASRNAACAGVRS